MNEEQWNTAHKIAQTLVQENTDVNELGKAIVYLRNAVNQQQTDAGSRFFKYIQTLVRNGRQIGHSGKTSDYYRSIDKACQHYLTKYQNDTKIMLQILGWTSRLMRYYKDGGIIGEISSSTQIPAYTITESSRQREIAVAAQSQSFQVGQIFEAKVTNIKGKEVTYELPGMLKLTVKEPKKYADLSVELIVKIEVLELRDNGVPKKVKCVN
ncbi:hypothetical protein WA1_02045 [Scytonema hofmannii PCC 7110]|uniref:Uncharacterized protein n=1 Tax=Scytonema hofmannii PCC 7110 TaxID=128403 RepID=A0A139XGZ5_9CYAN|nr:hypothetical protein [Scytonema hofmannii]KYC43951.1 hypothetical protein WA1_02045 [Scytonema hofmannii PCC 7110]